MWDMCYIMWRSYILWMLLVLITIVIIVFLRSYTPDAANFIIQILHLILTVTL